MAPTWTAESLAETAWALTRLLALVQEEKPSALNPTSEGYRLLVEQWLYAVKPLLQQERPLMSLIAPPFPLTSTQLGALEGDIHRVLAEHMRLQRGRRGARRAQRSWHLALSLSTSLEHLHTTLQAVDHSSRFIIEAVGSLFVLNALYLVLLIVLRHHLPLTTELVAVALLGNLILLAMIGALWWHHSAQLKQHREALGWHTAHHNRHGVA